MCPFLGALDQNDVYPMRSKPFYAHLGFQAPQNSWRFIGLKYLPRSHGMVQKKEPQFWT